jgi:hypothetical protein
MLQRFVLSKKNNYLCNQNLLTIFKQLPFKAQQNEETLLEEAVAVS